MGRIVAFSIVAAALLVLGLSGVALAENYFPPIYNDYAADRDLDGTYTRAQLLAYLDNAEVDQYGDPVIVADLDALVRAMLKEDDETSSTTLHGPPPAPGSYDPGLPWRHATPQEIYDDYAEDGDFDWNYYNEDIQAYLNDPMLDQYCDPATVAAIDALLTSMLNAKTTASAKDRDTFPFTGMPLALLVLGAAGLAGAGLGLRRLAGRDSA